MFHEANIKKNVKKNAFHPTGYIGFASLQGSTPPFLPHFQCCSQPLAPETPETADLPREGNSEHGILAVFSVKGVLSTNH